MKTIENLYWLKFKDKLILIIGETYKGSPKMMFNYDILFISEEQFKKHKEEIIFDKNNPPKIFFI